MAEQEFRLPQDVITPDKTHPNVTNQLDETLPHAHETEIQPIDSILEQLHQSCDRVLSMNLETLLPE